ncbi:MAG: NAD(P)/FAD-dependent oxidoreductase [Deltaproteobacteria bacterium]|nr:MAG: NAD(P)/FAD-dependent oxidoreductase [Deltaproteobacteria bacterium]
MRHVIIGNGIAGITAAETIRLLDPTSSITLIAGETFPPYSRPMLGMLVEGAIDDRQMILKEELFYREFQIDAKIGHWVEELDVPNKVVRTSKGERIPFDRLLIATGANPVRLSVEGSELQNIFFLRNREDAVKISQAAKSAKAAVVIGGGLVGLKAAHALRKRGLKVTIVEKLSYLLPFIADGRGGELVQREAENMGIEVITSAQVSGFEGGPRISGVFLEGATTITCQIVVVAAGVRPALSFVDPNQVQVCNGLVVNEFLETSAEGIYAAGDVAEVMDLVRGENRLVPIWPEAASQGRVAGINMVGFRKAYEGAMARNVLRFEGIDLLSGGLIGPDNGMNLRIIEYEDRRAGTYRRFVLNGDRLVGVVMVNKIEQGGVVLSLIKRRAALKIPDRLLQSPYFNFSQLLPRLG